MAFNYEVKLYAEISKIKGPDEEEALIPKSNSLRCECKYISTMGILCCHLLASGNKEISLKESLRERWKFVNSSNENDEDLITFIKNFLKNQSKALSF